MAPPTHQTTLLLLLLLAPLACEGRGDGSRDGGGGGGGGGQCAAGGGYTHTNRIVAENCREGSPSTEWDVNGSGDPSIMGFTVDISYNVGAEVHFKVKTPSQRWRIDIYRLGYYGGLGARKVDSIRPLKSLRLPQVQPECLFEESTYNVDCGNWRVSATWKIPSDSVSGLYFGKAIREDEEPEKYSKTGRNWRADNSQERVDLIHTIPGSDPFQPPDPIPHSYGATGHGKLRNPIRESRASHIFFVVRDDDGNSDLIFQTSDPTWQAYNGYGGLTTYGSFKFPWTHGPDPRPMEVGKAMPRAYKASYNRPLITRDYRNVNAPLHAEYPAIRFLERNGYDISYMAGVDTSRSGFNILRHRVFLSVGHDEYVSLEQRRAVEKARDEGVHLMFWAANEFYWSIRWEESMSDYDVRNNYTDPLAAKYRTLVCYKESQSMDKIDPLEGSWTGTFRDSRSINPRGPMPENELIGQLYTVNAQRVDSLIVPGEHFPKLRFWRNTSIAELSPDSRYVSFRGVLGHEWNEDIDNGYRPEGVIHLSETWVDNVQMVQDQGSVFDSGSARHTLTLYKAKSGALVFGSGTVQWAWGLDGHHDINDAPRANKYAIRVEMDTVGPDRNIQQSMINLFADMGVQPTTLQADLVLTKASQDNEPPQSRIIVVEKPKDSLLRVVASGQDGGDGCVAGMEVSLDGGSHWHPASRSESEWMYLFNISDMHQRLYELWDGDVCKLDVAVRAIDDSGNIGEQVDMKANPTEVLGENIRREFQRCR